MDLDLGKLRYFAAVAEHQNFGRAAEQLFVTQPVLSRQIRAFEQELGCTLFERTSRRVQLTPAGTQLYADAHPLLASVDATVRRVHEVDRGVERLVVAFTPGLHVSAAVRAFRATHPDVAVELLHLRWWDQDAPRRDGRADVGYLRRPFDDAGLRGVPIGSDPKVACLPSNHPLARRSALFLADLDGVQVLDAQVRRTSTVEEKFELVATGGVVAVVPETVASSYRRSDLAYLPVRDAPPAQTCLAVATDRREPRLAEFVELATTTLRRPEPHLAAAR